MIQSKEDIINGLDDRYAKLTDWLNSQATEKFSVSPMEGKWTTGEHVDHLIKSTKPLNQALGMPKMMIRQMFGKPNRTGRTYDELVQKYQSKLAEGGAASGQYIPKNITNKQKEELIEKLNKEKEKLKKIINKWNEEDLDKYLLPHPLLGKLTIREMLYFTVYHTSHHNKTLSEKYEQ